MGNKYSNYNFIELNNNPGFNYPYNFKDLPKVEPCKFNLNKYIDYFESKNYKIGKKKINIGDLEIYPKELNEKIKNYINDIIKMKESIQSKRKHFVQFYFNKDLILFQINEFPKLSITIYTFEKRD